MPVRIPAWQAWTPALRTHGAYISQAQAPVCVARKIGEHDDANYTGAERSAAGYVLPRTFSRVEPLGPIEAVQFGPAHLAARTALLEICQENILVGSARAVSPALVGADVVGLVGRDQVGQRNQF